MNKVEDLRPNATVKGILQGCLVTVVNAQWYGSTAVELTYKTPDGKVANELLYRHDEPRIEVVERGRPWSFDGEGAKFRLVSEAHRIRLAHLLDPSRGGKKQDPRAYQTMIRLLVPKWRLPQPAFGHSSARCTRGVQAGRFPAQSCRLSSME